MSVDRGHRGSRATSPRIASMGVTLLLLLGVALGTASLSDTPAALAAETEADPDGVTLVAAPADAGIVRQGTMLTVRVTVRNDTERILPASDVVLSVATGVATGEEPLDAPDRAPEGDPSSSLEDLVSWPHSTTAVAWPSAATTSDAALAALAASGAQTILAPSSRLSSEGPLLTLGGSRVLAVDSALSAALADAASARSSQAWTSAVARASALLAAAAAEGRDVIGAVDRDARSALRVTDLLDALDALPWRTPAALSTLLRGTPSGEAAVSDAAADDALTAAASSALAAEEADRAFSRIAADPAALIAERRLELLAASSPGWAHERIEALAGFVASSERLRSAVQVVDSSPILLLTDRTSVPITIQNALDVPVTVFVSVAPATGQLRVLDQRVEVTLEPDSSAQALVPVQSLTNGTVDITVSLRDSEGRPVGDSTSFELNLQAGWETAGTIAIAAVIALLFAIGIIRNVRKRRRRRLTANERETADSP